MWGFDSEGMCKSQRGFRFADLWAFEVTRYLLILAVGVGFLSMNLLDSLVDNGWFFIFLLEVWFLVRAWSWGLRFLLARACHSIGLRPKNRIELLRSSSLLGAWAKAQLRSRPKGLSYNIALLYNYFFEIIKRKS